MSKISKSKNPNFKISEGSRTVETIDLSVIIVSWNVWDDLRSCLHSIAAASDLPPAPALSTTNDVGTVQLDDITSSNGAVHTIDNYRVETIVVDNASTDATRDLVPTRFPWVRFIANTTNRGFTGGNNDGYAVSRGRLLLFLNPDTEIVGNAIPQMVRELDAAPHVGAIGPQMRYGDGSWQNNRRRFPSRLSGFFESTWCGQAWPGNPWTRRLHMLDWPHDRAHDVDWLVGAAIMARRTALDAAGRSLPRGPFDESFFMYSEEVDLCQRMRRAGWRIRYLPTAHIVHHEARSSDQVTATRHILFNYSKVHYYRKYFGKRWSELLRRFLLMEFGIQMVLERAKALVGHKRALRQERVAAYRSVLQSRLR